MSKPRTLYVEMTDDEHEAVLADPNEEHGSQIYVCYDLDHSGWEQMTRNPVRPATVDDLLAAIPKCEHGNYAPHIDGLRSYDDVRQGGQYVWCPGGAALGGTDDRT